MRILRLAASVCSLGVLIGARPQAPIARFQVVLERAGNGWRAHCDSGCTWIDLSIGCATDCHAFVDANGVAVDVAIPETKASFGFVIGRADDGWQAESVVGTSWTRVEWGCGRISCRARLDQDGVYPQSH